MRLDEPQVFVDVAGNPGEQVRRVGVPQFVGVGDRRANDLAVYRQLRGKIVQMVLARGDAQGIVLEFAAFGRHRNRALGGAAQARDAFRDFVDLLHYEVRYLVEQLMQGDEVRALDVPMSLFDLALQIDGVRQAIVQNGRDVAADLVRQVDLRLVHGIPFATAAKPFGYFALLWRRIPRKNVMSGAVFTATSSAKPNSTRQRSLKVRT